MRVRAKSVYTFNPVLFDIIDPPVGNIKSGDKVRVVKLRGCPPPNSMGHCHIEHPDTKEFLGLVCTSSLTR